MRKCKKMLRTLAVAHCILLLPAIGMAAEAKQPATEEKKAATEEVTKLDEVVVTAIPLEKYLLTTSVITAEDIAAKGAKNLAEALEDVPGLNIHRGKKNNTSLDIRGETSSDTKIFIDGVLVNPLAKMTSSSAVDITMIPTDNIAKIEIIKGPAPVTYGIDAKGGVIWITTKNGKTNAGGELSIVRGSWNTLNGSVSYGGGDNKFNYYLNAGGEQTDGYINDARKSKYFNVKMNWRLQDNESLTFTGGYSLTDKNCLNGTDPVDGHTISSKNGFWAGMNSWEFRDWEKTNLSLNYSKKVNDKLDYTVKVYRFTETQELWGNGANYSSSAVTPNAKGIVNGNASDMGYSIRRWNRSSWESSLNGVELQSNWKLNKVHTLTFGMLYNDIDWKNSASIDPVNDPYNPNSYKWLNYNNKRYGYYLQDNIVPNEKWTITLGVRNDRNEVTSTDNTTNVVTATKPSVNILYQMDSRTAARASFGQTISFPSVEQLFSSAKGNQNLKPEMANNYEVGFKHKFSEKVSGDIAFFQSDIQDKIDVDPVTKKNYNLASATIKGIELELEQKFSERLKGFVNYTYLDTQAVQPNGTTTELTYTPRHHFNYGVTYRAGKGYTVSVTGHWVSRRYTGDTGSGDTRSKVNGQTPVYDYVGSYNVLDIKVSRKVSDRQEWYVMVNNLFDRQYYDELFYTAAGRSVMFGVNYKFR
ncbi:MAG TPA: TonB-dependent receptor [Patescibacteria group bacterium]|nr:TonB-dependent receptor [Patescibacteria group bacterium]